MTNEEKCKHYDRENGWCKKLSDWSDPMPHIVYCPKSPCEHAEPIEQPMTDDDIIKALGYCFAVGDCEHCVYADKPCQELMADALKLINRLKSEIEEQDRAIINALHRMKVVRAEAIKEFAERTKDMDLYRCVEEHYRNAEICYEFRQDLFCEDIDNLVKEMTEGEDESDFEM